MIKFFRNIRQKLLAQQKIGQYLKYAAGEIILVVIGILIALQINNWNEARKDAKVKDSYLAGLTADANNNIRSLDAHIGRAVAYVQKVDSLMATTNEPLKKADLDKIGIQRQTYFMMEDTYQEIIANGHLKLLPESVKSGLMQLNTFFKAANKVDAANTNMINTHHLKMAEFYELKRLDHPSNYSVISSGASDTEQALLIYRNYINISYDWMKTQLFFYERLKKQQLALIDLIEKDLSGS